MLTTDLKLRTELWHKNSDINISVHYLNPLTINGYIKTTYETLQLNDIKIDSQKQELEGEYIVVLKQTSKEAAIRHGNATFTGTLSSMPYEQITLHSDSFGGPLNIIATQDNMTLQADTIELDDVIDFLEINSSLRSGTADIYVNVKDDNLLEFNTSTLKAELSIDAQNVVLYGIEVDDNINQLRDFNDINIFEGNFPGKSIATSIITAPVKVIEQKNIPTSNIGHIRIDGYAENGRFYLYDCAVSTEQNRVAAKGIVDFNTTDFHYFEVGLLQDNGCAFFTQDILGSVKKPNIELSKTSLSLLTGTAKSVGSIAKNTLNLGTKIVSKVGSLTGQAINKTTGYIPVVNRATGAVSTTVTTITDTPNKTNALLNSKCIPFYRGMVQHPTQHKRLYQSDILLK